MRRAGLLGASGVAVAAWCTIVAAQPASAPGTPQAQAVRIARDLTTELVRIRTYLVPFDQLNRLDVAQGRLPAVEADQRLRAKGQELYGRSYPDADLARLLDQHRDAVRAYLRQAEQAIAAATRWPADQPADAYRTRARARLELLRTDHEARVTARLDALPVLRGTAEVLAWTRGEALLSASADPFAGQPQRVATALPSPDLQRAIGAAGQLADAAATGSRPPAPPPVVAGPVAPSTPPTPPLAPPKSGTPVTPPPVSPPAVTPSVPGGPSVATERGTAGGIPPPIPFPLPPGAIVTTPSGPGSPGSDPTVVAPRPPVVAIPATPEVTGPNRPGGRPRAAVPPIKWSMTAAPLRAATGSRFTWLVRPTARSRRSPGRAGTRTTRRSARQPSTPDGSPPRTAGS